MLAQMSAETAAGWDKVGIIGILVAVIAGGAASFLFGWVVPGSYYRSVLEERNSLRDECRKLWEEKAGDARKASEIAEAYMRIRERDKSD